MSQGKRRKNQPLVFCTFSSPTLGSNRSGANHRGLKWSKQWLTFLDANHGSCSAPHWTAGFTASASPHHRQLGQQSKALANSLPGTADIKSDSPGGTDVVKLILGSGSVGARRLFALTLRLGVALCFLLVLPSSSPAAQSSRKTASSSLMVQIGEEVQLQVNGNGLVLKMRLSPGVVARLWSNSTCGAPTEDAMIVTNSGSYIIDLSNIPHEGKSFICLLSSDGKLHEALAFPVRESGTKESI